MGAPKIKINAFIKFIKTRVCFFSLARLNATPKIKIAHTRLTFPRGAIIFFKLKVPAAEEGTETKRRRGSQRQRKRKNERERDENESGNKERKGEKGNPAQCPRRANAKGGPWAKAG